MVIYWKLISTFKQSFSFATHFILLKNIHTQHLLIIVQIFGPPMYFIHISADIWQTQPIQLGRGVVPRSLSVMFAFYSRCPRWCNVDPRWRTSFEIVHVDPRLQLLSRRFQEQTTVWCLLTTSILVPSRLQLLFARLGCKYINLLHGQDWSDRPPMKAGVQISLRLIRYCV